MKGDPLQDTKDALLSFIGETRREDHIALISFADRDKPESLFGKPRQDLVKAAEGLKIRGGLTRLYQTLYDSLDRFEDAEIPKRRRVIVITDGKDEGSTASAQNVIKKSNDLRIPIDAVGRGKIPDHYTEGLRGLARDSGGRFVHARPDRVDLTDAIHRIYRDLLETRSLVISFKYEMDDSKQTTQNAKINLQLPGEDPISVRISEEIPTQKVRSDLRLYLLLSIFLVLCIGLFIWIRHIFKEDEPKPGVNDLLKEKRLEPPVVEPPDTKLQPLETPVVEPHPKATKVGGYFPAGSESGRPAFRLVAISGPAEGQQAEMADDIFNIGADSDNDLNLTEDEYVSGQHASIRYEEGNFLIFDKGSRNGTFVNKSNVTTGGFVLNNGDLITIGRSTFEVVSGSR
jgi:hypothetical protein